MSIEIYRVNKILPKIYGPYVYKSTGRKHVVLAYGNSKISKPYSRYLMEVHIGRILDGRKETVDHVDGDKTNDVIENLQILSLSENVKKAWEDGTYNDQKVSKIQLTCPLCSKNFLLTNGAYNWKKKKYNSGPYCSKSCSNTITSSKKIFC